MSDFSETVRAARQRRQAEEGSGFSLRAVASRVGLSPSAMSQIENGGLLPEEQTVRRIASEIGFDPDELVSLSGRLPVALRDVLLDRPELRGLVEKLATASPEKVEQVMKMIDEGDW